MKTIYKNGVELLRAAGSIRDDFLTALSTIVSNITPRDQLARRVLVEICIMNLPVLRKETEFPSMLKKFPEVGTATLLHDGLERLFRVIWCAGFVS